MGQGRWWLYGIILLLVAANSFVFYRLFSERINLSQLTSYFEPEPSEQRQQAAKKAEKEATVVVPILMYHYIRDYANPDDQLGIQLSVAPAVFQKQLQTIKAAGYQTVSLENFADGKIKPKSIILTFDDGYADHYSAALPILKEEKMTATFFIVKGFVGRPNYMSAKEITELEAAGMEIGGHTLTHVNLASKTAEVALKEIRDSLRGTSPVFAYPAGKYSETAIEILQGLGVKASVTTNLGLATNKTEPLLLPRIRVKQQTDILRVIEEQQYLLDHPKTDPKTLDLSASKAN